MPEGDRPHPRPRRPSFKVVTASLVVLVLVAAGAAYRLDLGERWGISADPQEDPAAVAPPSGLELPEPAAAGTVADPLRSTRLDPTAVRAAVGRLPVDRRMGRRLAVVVADGTGRVALGLGPAVVTPASTLKILTSLAAVEVLGPEHRFTTSVTRSGGRLTLVGGGDPLLTRRADPDEYPQQADLATLARRTAAALRDEGRRRVQLGYDSSMFTGPSVDPSWEQDYVPDDVVSPIVPLWIDEGRVAPGEVERSPEAERDAALAFAAELRDQGVIVRGRPQPVTSPAGAEEVAAVESAELVEIVQHLLESSDNEATEVLARHVAIGLGRPGSSDEASLAVTSVLEELGIDTDGMDIHDGSGLSRDNRVPVQSLVDALALAGDHPQLAGVVEGLPVAGFTGSLSYRFATLDGASEPGLGRARLKTGTLTGVHGYAGVVVGRDGSVMLLVTVADRVRVRHTLFARDQLDRIAAALADCACGGG